MALIQIAERYYRGILYSRSGIYFAIELWYSIKEQRNMSRLLLSSGLFLVVITLVFQSRGNTNFLDDPWAKEYTEASSVVDTLPPIPPRYEDFINDTGSNPFDLEDPSIIEQKVEYDPETGMYIISEKIGDFEYRPSSFMTFSEYLEWKKKEEEKKYFKQLSGVKVDGDNGALKDPIDKLEIDFNPFEQLFGGLDIDIQPQGNIDLTFGFNHSFSDNPTFPTSQTSFTNFDFDMDIQMSLVGKIGEKLSLTTNYNTGSTFNFDNQIKLDYNSDLFGEDDILKRVEAGDVSLPLKGTLIQGAPSLFGLKTEMQFGHLRLTTIVSSQKTENENITLEGGAQVQEFEVPVVDYDENRHFFLSHYNRANFEEGMANLPYINSLFYVKNIEVWVTNDRNEVNDVRDVLALTDLGEADPSKLTNGAAININPAAPRDVYGELLPSNNSNDLYDRLINNPEVKDISKAVNVLKTEFQLEQGRDFEKVSARRLGPSEYEYYPQLGFISLNVNIRPDQVVAVSYDYDYDVDSPAYSVGQRASAVNDISSDLENPTQQVLFLKMLKSTNQRTDLPSWDLMMKNIYSIGAYGVDGTDFQLGIFHDDPGRGVKNFLPESNLAGVPLLEVFGLDRLNSQQDPFPDGRFDFIEGKTINTNNGRVIFPVLEPFGKSLADKLTEQKYKDAYAYEDLYTQTPFQAIENAERNRFLIKGSYKSSVSSEISLGAFNIPPGSVTVRAGGKILEEGIDYEVDYGSGRLRILQDAYLISGVPINVSFAEQNVFGLNQKTMLGLRADYEVSDNLTLGATAMKLFERPYTPKVNVGEDPINNNIYGLDVNFNKELPWLTRAINALPLVSTKETSEVFFSAEGAYLSPGHARAINASRKDKEGIVYLDDFEGSSSPTNLKTAPQVNWFLASIPQNDDQNNNPMFPEADAGGIISGVNRAQLNWYTIFASNRNNNNNLDNSEIIADPYNTPVRQTEIFPNVQLNAQDRAFTYQTLDLSFYPGERGPYNYDTPDGYPGYSAGVNLADGSTVQLNNPEDRWGGIMRSIRNPDFQTSNIEFLEFWVLSPFLDNADAREPASNVEDREGSLFINFGNISEDILRDSRHFSENSLPTSPDDVTRRVNETPWGLVPLNQAVTNAFDNTSDEARTNQDVGLDGLNDAQEASRFADYISALTATNPTVGAKVAEDPSNDNFVHYQQATDDNVEGQRRYYYFNNTQGNSNRAQGANSSSSTLRPDDEDLNDDNSLNESESYFQYEIPFKSNPFDPREIDVQNTPFITDRIEDPGNHRVWYRFKIPLRTEQKQAIGGITDFRSIRFMRMYMKGFKAPVTLRLGSLELVRNSWRRYTQDLVDPRDIDGVVPSCGNDVSFEIDAVSIEENSGRVPFNYTLPPGINREQNIGIITTQQNEQSLVLKTKDLCDGDARGVFKVVETDMRVYERLKMFVHAEEVDDEEVPEGQMSVFIRLGKDMKENYYEYEIPLVMSDPDILDGQNSSSLAYKEEVWKKANEFDFALAILKDLKKERNGANFDLTREYTKDLAISGNTHTIKVKGNPNLGLVKIAMIGIRNPFNNDGASYSTEIWANELRFTGLDEKGGVAGIARMDVTMADLGSFSASTDYSSFGFGAINEGVHERSMERRAGYDMSVELNLDKFLPEKSGVKIPFYAQTSNSTITPEFDPYDLDLTLEEKMEEFDEQYQKDSIRNQAIEKVTRRSFNFTNVRKEKTGSSQKSKPWDVENLSATYSWSETKTQTPFVEFENEKQQKGSLDYAYSNSPKYVKPFKGIKSKHLKLISNFNFNPLPNSFTFSNFLDRRFIATRYRFSELSEVDGTYYTKYFTWDREYNLNWNLASSLKFNFNALSKSIIDEPDEKAMRKDPSIQDIDAYRRDSIWTNIASLGRAKNYSHNFSVNYTLPIRHLPYMDWITIKAQYQGDYAWSAPGVAFNHLGNTIQNGQKRQINGDFNFVKLYDKSKYLKKINRGKKRKGDKKKRGSVSKDDKAPKDKSSPKSKAKKGNEPTEIERILIRPLMLVRRAKLNYRENFQTVVPGFAPESSLLGMSSGFDAPGWGFVAGLQPNIANVTEAEIGTSSDWLYANRAWITPDYGLNDYVVQDYSETFDGQLTIEPVRDFTITLDAKKTYSKNHTQRFKNTILDSGEDDYVHGLPTEGGAMTITYSAINTLFKDSESQLNELFAQFGQNQIILSQRLGTGVHQNPDWAEEGYTYGYGRNQQDIQVPAFLAAYTGQDAETMNLDLFATLPRVNWKVTYDGLSKVGFFKEYLQNFSLTHGYKSTLTVSNYRTNAYYQNNEDHFDSEETYNFYTRYEIPNVTITEGFEPLIGISTTMQNGMNFDFSYSKTRTLALSTVNNLLNEKTAKDWSITYGWLLKDVDIPFLTGSKKKKGKKKTEEEEKKKSPLNARGGRGGRRLEGKDLDVQFNMSLRDDIVLARKLDLGTTEKVSGNYELSLSPSIEYKLSKQLSLRLFFEYRRTLPVISTVAERVTSAGGVVVRFEL